MSRILRNISLLLALGLGCAALAWGLYWLHDIFVEERDTALSELAGRRRALEQFAHKELEQRLQARLDEARPTIEAAARDPLIPASEVWLVDGGQQVLPRTDRVLPGSTTPAAALYQKLVSPKSESELEDAQARDPESPWTERLMLLEDLKRALAAGDREGVEKSFRAILAHRASYVISTAREIPYTLAALATLEANARPQTALMESLLRTGLSGQTTRIEGMEREILMNRARFTEADLEFLKQRVVELCEPHNVLYADFVARVEEAPGTELTLPAELSGPMLLYSGHWYVEPAQNQRVHGIALKVSAVLDEITSAMRDRAILGPEDEVRGAPAVATVALSDLALEIESPEWQPATDTIDARYRLKSFLEVLIAALVFGVMGLGAWVYRRRHRFLELKSDFVSAVSHELRTPLASIRLMAETIERRTKGVPKVRDYPSRIIRDVDALSFLVENILSFNRLSRGRWTPKLERVRLVGIIEKLEAERDHWARRKAELESDGVDQVTLSADPDLLQLLLTNLARNACQYNEREVARVRVAAARDGEAWVVRVSDNGMGIPEGEGERIFDDFYRSGGGKKTGERGSGLGLSICRKIMEAHQGSIRVAETSTNGTTFALTFPDRAP